LTPIATARSVGPLTGARHSGAFTTSAGRLRRKVNVAVWERTIVEVTGLFSLLVLIADVYAIVNIFNSNASTGSKVIWIVVVLVLPLIGFIAWFFAGPRSGRS
jgi:hypothetical protein